MHLVSVAILVACNGNVAVEGNGRLSPSTGSEVGGSDSAGPDWFGSQDFEQGEQMPSTCEGPLGVQARPVLRRTETQIRTTLDDVMGSRFSQITLTEDSRVAGYRAHSDVVTELEATRYSEFAREVAQSAPLDCSGDCKSVVLAKISELYGRSVTQEERLRFEAGFDAIISDLGAGEAGAAKLVLEAALQSPGFLYGLEPSTDEATAVRGADLAKRLAQFLWLSVPDAELLRAAEQGELESDAGYETQVRRMLEDPKADRLLLDFHRQWLWLDEVRGPSRPSAELFPNVDDNVFDAMKAEFDRFVLDTVRSDDGSLETLFAGRVSRPGSALQTIYGESLDGSERVMDEARAGVLSLPWVLSIHAHPDESSTVWRGQLLRTQLLCSAIPAPPANAALLAPDATGLSKPDAFAALLAVENGGCATCHQMMDPLGFALEHFDASGAYRTIDERGFEVDATGSAFAVPEDDALAQGFYGARELGEALASSSIAGRCYVEQWLRYAWHASPRGDNACHAQTVYQKFVDSGRRIEELVVAIVMSPAFRLHSPQSEELVCQ